MITRRDSQRHHVEVQVDDTDVTYEAGYGETPSRAIVTAVSSALNCDETELEPLNTAVDPDALNSLFRSTSSVNRGGGSVSFRYAGCEVVVECEGTPSRGEPVSDGFETVSPQTSIQ